MSDTTHPADEYKTQLTACMDTLSARLAEGRSEGLIAFLTFAARFHKYSAQNQMLIWLQAPEARFVAGFHDWKRHGRNVKKGGKSIKIFAPVTRKVEDEVSGEQVRRMVNVRVVSVFPDSETEGDDLPEPPSFSNIDGGTLGMVQEFARMTPIPTVWEATGSTAHGYTDGQRIVLDPDKAGETPGHALRVLFHEWAHYELHICEKGRRKDAATDRAVRELEADAAAFVLCSIVGVDAAAAVGEYVSGWGGQPEQLAQSLGNISRAVLAVMKVINPAPFQADEEARAHSAAAYQASKKKNKPRKSAA